jgi:hypothetical protein
MADAPARNVGTRLADDVLIFRAFSDKSYRHRKQNKVRAGAYLIREVDLVDGLSVGLTPAAAVQHLTRNHGCCSIRVGDIHSLPYDLEVRADPADPNHAFIVNLPLGTLNDDRRAAAQLIAGELARKSTPVSFDPITP